MSPKKPRTCNDKISHLDLVHALTPHAKQKKLEWDWEMDHYGKKNRKPYFFAIHVYRFSPCVWTGPPSSPCSPVHVSGQDHPPPHHPSHQVQFSTRLDWTIIVMPSPSVRNCGPDREGLEFYFVLLSVILAFAPGGIHTYIYIYEYIHLCMKVYTYKDIYTF